MPRRKKTPHSTLGSTSHPHPHHEQQQQKQEQEQEQQPNQHQAQQPPNQQQEHHQQQPHQQREDPQLQGLMEALQQARQRQEKQKEVIIIDDDDDEEMKQDDEDNEFVDIDLEPLQKFLTCPICLDILRQTRAVTECLHRFCKTCIDKAMRLGKHECPACRTHVTSKRSLREDARYDLIIAALYPNINETRIETLELNEEEKNHHKQIQASMEETGRRQTEALPKRLTITPSSSRRRSHGSGRRGRRRKAPNNDIDQGPDNNENANANDGGRDASSPAHPVFTSDAAGPSENQDVDKHDEVAVNRDTTPPVTEVGGVTEMPTWGRGGLRSQSRREYGSSSRNDQGTRLTRLVNHLDMLRLDREGNDDEFEIHREDGDEPEICVALITLDERTLPTLEQSYISCPLSHTVKQLRQHVANQFGLQLKEVELYLVINPIFPTSGSTPVYDPSQGGARLLRSMETLQGLQSNCAADGVLVLGYMRKFVKQ